MKNATSKNVFPLWIPVHHGGFKERTFAGMTNLYWLVFQQTCIEWFFRSLYFI